MAGWRCPEQPGYAPARRDRMVSGHGLVLAGGQLGPLSRSEVAVAGAAAEDLLKALGRVPGPRVRGAAGTRWSRSWPSPCARCWPGQVDRGVAADAPPRLRAQPAQAFRLPSDAPPGQRNPCSRGVLPDGRITWRPATATSLVTVIGPGGVGKTGVAGVRWLAQPSGTGCGTIPGMSWRVPYS